MAYNQNLRKLLEDIQDPFDFQIETLNLPDNLWDWTLKVRRLKKQPWTFEDREYLKQIYLDDAKEAAIAKGRQTEFTEYSINWLFYNLSTHPLTIGLYTTDRFSHLREYSNIRMKRWALEDSELMQKLALPKDHTMTLMPFLNGSMLLMHSAFHGFEEARSIPVDFAVVDERQSTSGEDLEVLRQSLFASKYGWLRIIGTGDVEGSDWEKDYKAGTQYHWKNKKWVAQNPGAEVHSYWVPQTLSPNYNHEEAEKIRKRNLRAWMTEVMGQFFRGAKKPITESEMRSLFDKSLHILTSTQAKKLKGWTLMGIDWGGGEQAFTVPWITKIMDENIPLSRLIYTTKITERSTEKQADMMINLAKEFEVDQIVMDAGGGTRQVEKMEDTFGYKATKCRYIESSDKPIIQDKLDSDNLIKVDRTWLIETTIDRVTRPWPDGPKSLNRIMLPGADMEEMEWVIDHFTAIEAKHGKSSTGRTLTRYDNPLGPDDALHACGYEYLAWWIKRNTTAFPGAIESVSFDV